MPSTPAGVARGLQVSRGDVRQNLFLQGQVGYQRAATERSRAPDPSSSAPDRLVGRHTPCASDSSSARRSRASLQARATNSCPGLSAPQSGAASARPAPHPSSDLAACPDSLVLADPHQSARSKASGQVTAPAREPHRVQRVGLCLAGGDASPTLTAANTDRRAALHLRPAGLDPGRSRSRFSDSHPSIADRPSVRWADRCLAPGSPPWPTPSETMS